ncbi:NmrA family NAD(P)-binding protein [Roseiarcus sp.]|uniref:NmrA family NAD(P)-binding protein n=1 Tax=Roseiarcus sp. TaxID=1969460 RepID=UPI003F9BF3AB
MKTIAIIGHSGTNARPWTEAFLAAGWRVRSLVRDPERAMRPRSLTPVAFDLDAPGRYESAVAGVDVLALVTPAHPRQVAWEGVLIEAAEPRAVGGIVKLSVIGADLARPISYFARNAAEAETTLRASRVPHVILRASGFMQNLLRQRASIEAGSLVDPSGGAPASLVDVLDLADVAVAVANGPFDGRALTVTGPAALTGDEMAAALSTVMKRPVRLVSPPLASFRAVLAESGLPAWRVDAAVELQEAILDGRAPHLAEVSGDVPAATGRPARAFAEFARREFAPSS